MKQLVQSLVEVISAFGNPLEDDYPELIFKVTRLCRRLGNMQYLKYVADVINSGKASIHDTTAKSQNQLSK